MKVRCLLIGMGVLFVVSLLATQSYAKIDEDNIVGIWLFDEGEGDTAEDSSGNKNDGTVNGAEWVDDMSQSGKALEFDGSSSHVLIQFLDPAPKSISLEAWIYPTAGGVVFSELGQAAVNSGWHDSQMEILSSGEIKVGYWTGAEQGISLGTYSFDAWYHVVMTFDDGDNTTYRSLIFGPKFEAHHNILYGYDHWYTRRIGKYLPIPQCDSIFGRIPQYVV